MNLTAQWVPFLAQRGIDSVTWDALGSPDAEDVEIMGYAREHGLVVVTGDLDFGELLAAGSERLPSVVQLRVPAPTPWDAGEQLAAALSSVDVRKAVEAGSIVTVSPDRAPRISALPIGGAGKP